MEGLTTSNEQSSNPNGFFTFSAGPDKLRRNGKPMSCEPCRISKIKCDHTFPCRKCQNRGIKDKCSYKHAPMSKPVSEHNRATKANGRHQVRKSVTRSTSLRRAKLSNAAVPCPPTPVTTSPTTRSPVSSLQLSNPPTVAQRNESPTETRTPEEPTRPGYLGFTSFASSFPEHEVSLADPPFDQYNPLSGYSNEDYPNSWRTGKEQMLMQTLRRWDIIEKLVDAYYARAHFSFIPGPFLVEPLPIIGEQLAEVFASQDSTSVAEFAKMVTANSCKPFKVHVDTPPREFHHLYCGPNLRWEFMGSVIAIAGLGAIFSEQGRVHTIFEEETDITMQSFVKLMCMASSACRELCCEISPLSDVMTWFLAQDAILQSNYVGDTSHLIWRRFGDLTSDLFALGFHRNQEISANVPFYLAETRKRIWGKCCRSDKGISTFLGRPPRISRHYCDDIVPLDLDDDSLLLEGDELAAKMAELDEDGWNTQEIVDGKVRPTAVIRMRYQSSLVREEILELSLGGERDEDITEKLNAMISRCHTVWESFPRWLRYDSTPYIDSLSSTGRMVLQLAYLEHLQTVFQVHRLLSRQSQTYWPALFDVSVQSLNTVVEIMRTRSSHVDVRHEFPWILMFHGLPAAGIIATELRRCTLQNKTVPPQIPRASVLRTLSVLIPWFDWIVTPDSSGYNCNYEFCAGIVRMLSRTLDDILNHDPTAPTPPAQSSNSNEAAAASNSTPPLPPADVQVAGSPLPTPGPGAIPFPWSSSQRSGLKRTSSGLGRGFSCSAGSAAGAAAGGAGAGPLVSSAAGAEGGGAAAGTMGDEVFAGLDQAGMPMESESFLTWLDTLDWENAMAMPLPELYPSSSNPLSSNPFRDGVPE